MSPHALLRQPFELAPPQAPAVHKRECAAAAAGGKTGAALLRAHPLAGKATLACDLSAQHSTRLRQLAWNPVDSSALLTVEDARVQTWRVREAAAEVGWRAGPGQAGCPMPQGGRKSVARRGPAHARDSGARHAARRPRALRWRATRRSWAAPPGTPTAPCGSARRRAAASRCAWPCSPALPRMQSGTVQQPHWHLLRSH